MTRNLTRKAIAIMITMMMIFSSVGFAFANDGSDIKNHWAEKEIKEWMSNNLINGYPDGTFKPNKNITRAEFMSLVNKAFGYTKTSNITYLDVPSNSWYAEVVAIAKGAGYIGGYPDGTMKPNSPITRQEASTIIMKIKGLSEDVKGISKFKDEDSIPNWSKGAIGAVASDGIMGGYPDGTFKAESPIKRAEAVVALNNALDTQETIVYDKEGTYGKEKETTNIIGNVIIKSKNIVLQNTIIEGNLLLDKKIGDGDITLDDVIVKGDTDIQGGGENSIHINDSTLSDVRIDKEDEKIRVVIKGKTTIGKVILESGAKLEEDDLTEDGFEEIIITKYAKDKIVLDGKFKNVIVKSKDITIETLRGSVVKSMILEESAKITGSGTIEKAEVNASGVSFEKKPKDIETKEGVREPRIRRKRSSGGSSSGSNSSNQTKFQVKFIVNNGNGDALEGASVNFNGETVETNSNGEALFTNIEAGSNKEYTVSAEGYNIQKGSTNVDNQNLEVPITLDNAPVTLNNLFVEKDIIFINNPTENRITIEVPNSANELAPVEGEKLSPVQLFIQNNGSWESIGFLYDDGDLDNHSDEIKADHVYSNTFEFNYSEIGEKKLQVVATSVDGKETTKDFSINFLEDTKGEDVEKAVNTLSAVEESIKNEFNEENQATTEKLLDKLEETVVSKEGVSSTTRQGNTFEIQYDTGIKTIITVENEDESNRSIGILSQDLTSEDTVQSTVYGTVYDEVYNYDRIGSNSALIWAPFANEFAPFDESEDLRSILDGSSINFDINVLKDGAANVDTLKNMTDYGLIVLATHGANGKWVGTGEVVGTDNKQKYEAQQKLGRMAIWKKMKIKKGGVVPSQPVYAVNDKWFEANIQGQFPNSIIINNSCESTKTDKLWRVFQDRGAGAYLGYNKIVSSKFAVEQAKEFVQGIAIGKTSGEAYIPKSDVTYNNSQWEMKGNDNLAFSNQGLINGSFEKGLTGWKTDGDGRVISGLAHLDPTEANKMAIISTGLGFTDKQGSISQTFVIPNNATKLSFDWNYLSEEFLEYIGSIFDDPYTITITTQDGEETKILDLSVNKIAEEFGASHSNGYSYDKYEQDPGLEDVVDETNKDNTNEEDSQYEQNGGNLIHVSPTIVFDRGDVWMTGWQSFEYDIKSFRGKEVTLKFYAVDGGDSIYDTAVIIDGISIE